MNKETQHTFIYGAYLLTPTISLLATPFQNVAIFSKPFIHHAHPTRQQGTSYHLARASHRTVRPYVTMLTATRCALMTAPRRRIVSRIIPGTHHQIPGAHTLLLFKMLQKIVNIYYAVDSTNTCTTMTIPRPTRRPLPPKPA